MDKYMIAPHWHKAVRGPIFSTEKRIEDLHVPKALPRFLCVALVVSLIGFKIASTLVHSTWRKRQMKKTLLEHHYEFRIASLRDDPDAKVKNYLAAVEHLATEYGWNHLCDRDSIDVRIQKLHGS
jgi:hypothetical protein